MNGLLWPPRSPYLFSTPSLLAAHYHRGMSTVCGKVGRHEQAQAEPATAAAMYGAQETALWLAHGECSALP
jgi:hypothetical protein